MNANPTPAVEPVVRWSRPEGERTEDLLVVLHGFDVLHLHGQTARRSVGGVLCITLNQLRFFQAFGNRSGKMVAQIIEGFWREFFSEKFD